LAGFALGCSSELFQRLFPTRDPAIRDVLINWSAVMIGLAANQAVLRAVNSRRTQTEPTEYGTAGDLLALQSAIGGSQIPVASEDTRHDESELAILEPAQHGHRG
jgi:hypothetical protein